MKTCVVLALFLMAGVSLGDIQKRVNNGRPCTADETKSFVFIAGCSGTVIGDGSWILTARHCKEGGVLGWMVRLLFPNIKDVTLTQKFKAKKTFKHATADIMLIKVNTSMEGMPLVPEAVCNDVLNQINTNTVPMVVPARHTKEEDKTWKDVSMCADIDVKGRSIMEDTKEEVVYWSPGACDTCEGDSGAGYIYKNALFAVETGTMTLEGQAKEENYGHIVCNGNIRNWIVNTMNNNP